MFPLLEVSFTEGLSSAGDLAGYSVSQSFPALVGLLIQIVLGVLGVVFLLLIIYGGLTWMTSIGNEKTVTKARGIITQATIGLVIILASYLISSFIFDALGGAISGPTGLSP